MNQHALLNTVLQLHDNVDIDKLNQALSEALKPFGCIHQPPADTSFISVINYRDIDFPCQLVWLKLPNRNPTGKTNYFADHIINGDLLTSSELNEMKRFGVCKELYAVLPEKENGFSNDLGIPQLALHYPPATAGYVSSLGFAVTPDITPLCRFTSVDDFDDDFGIPDLSSYLLLLIALPEKITNQEIERIKNQDTAPYDDDMSV